MISRQYSLNRRTRSSILLSGLVSGHVLIAGVTDKILHGFDRHLGITPLQGVRNALVVANDGEPIANPENDHIADREKGFDQVLSGLAPLPLADKGLVGYRARLSQRGGQECGV